MALIVQKYGGSSVATAEKIRNICKNIAKAYDEGNQVVVVLSAQGDTTDHLIHKMLEINASASPRESDMLWEVDIISQKKATILKGLKALFSMHRKNGICVYISNPAKQLH